MSYQTSQHAFEIEDLIEEEDDDDNENVDLFLSTTWGDDDFDPRDLDDPRDDIDLRDLDDPRDYEETDDHGDWDYSGSDFWGDY